MLAKAHPSRLADIAATDVRLSLIITYQQLRNAGVIQTPIPDAVYTRLLRDAAPAERVKLTLALLEGNQGIPGFSARIPDDLVALAIYEATPDQVNEFVFLVNWSESISRAIAEKTRKDHVARIPAELEILQWPDPTDKIADVPFVAETAAVRAPIDPDARVALVDAFQCLWAYEIIDQSLPADIVADAIETLMANDDRVELHRLLELIPDEVANSALVQAALDRSCRSSVGPAPAGPVVTQPYAVVSLEARLHGAA